MRSKPSRAKSNVAATTSQGVQARTINLTKIKEDNHLRGLLLKEFTYDKNVEPRLQLKREYMEQKELLNDLYGKKYFERNWPLVDGVNKFVEKSLNLRGEHLFDAEREQIFGEILILNMQTSDHVLIFDMIERSLKRLVSNLQVVRLRARSIKKKGISELLEQTKQSKLVFIFIEEAECLSRILTETLVGHLRNRLADESSPTAAIMVLFCLSTRIQVLPFDNLHAFGRMRGIVKETSHIGSETIETLLRSRNLRVKLGPLVVHDIHDYTNLADSSLTHIKYLHNTAIFEHYQKLEERLGQPRPNLELFEEKHQHLCDQIYVFTKLLHDWGSWCSSPLDICDVFRSHNDLAQSTEFVDAIKGLKKFPHESLVRRLNEIERLYCTTDVKKTSDAVSILMAYKDKIINNKDYQEILDKMIQDLLLYAETIENPFKDNDVYFDGKLQTIFSSSRGSAKALDLYSDESTYFGILFKVIQQSPSTVSASDLCDEVLDAYKKMIQSERNTKTITKSKQPSPKKRPRRQTTVMTEKVTDDNNGQNTEDELDGLAKAIFVDMIDCMEHQGIIKIDPRSKKKIIKKMAWPEVDL